MTGENTYPVELSEVCSFLEHIAPFDALTKAQRGFAGSKIHIAYYERGSAERILDYDNPSLFIVRAGIFDVLDEDGELIDRVSEGSCFGFISLLTGKQTKHSIRVQESGLVYQLAAESFRDLRNQNLVFEQFFTQAFEQRLRVGLRRRSENSALATPLKQVASDGLITCAPQTPIHDVAKIMSEHDIASIVIVDKENSLAGIFTDKDIRKRVVAKSLDAATPVSEVMSAAPITISHQAYVHEAIALMTRHGIKHLILCDQQQAVGMVTLSDIIRLNSTEPVLLISEIRRANSIAELQEISQRIPDLLLHLIKLDVRADDLGRILTSVTSTLTRRLIELAQQTLGPEPVPFVWLAFGSQGRQDQSAKSDQDNGLLLSDEASDEHDHYFEELAKFVNKGLDACGYVYCPGDIMAQNSDWRMPLKGWLNTFYNWIHEPSTKALMHASIFFDARPIFASTGADSLFEELQSQVLSWAKNNSIFLALMSSNAQDNRPPLGFVRQFVVETSGANADTFDIKKVGMMPLTDIARVHALATGIKAINTRERFHALMEQKQLRSREAKNLLDAHEYIAHQRLLHQGGQLAQGLAADNHLSPKSMSPLSQQYLKDAFKVVRDAQKGLKQRYQSGLI